MRTGLVIPAGQWVVVDPDTWARDDITLAGEDHHHLGRVLRLRPGDEVGVLNGRGGVARAEVVGLSASNLQVRVRERENIPPPHPRITLCQALLREAAMHVVIESAVELGAHRLIVFSAGRSIARHLPDRAQARCARWRRIVLNAIRQCGQPWPPEIIGILSLDEALEHVTQTGLRLWGSLIEGAEPLRKVLGRETGQSLESVSVFIGPEGDFLQKEEALLRSSGVQPVSFGLGVLRAETAAVFALSVLRYEFGPR